MTIESIIFFMKANILKFYIAVVPTGFFMYTADEVLAIQLFFIILALDVILGITLAVKMRRFSSYQMGRVIPKFIAYASAIIITTVITRLLPETSALLYYTVSFFILRELSSNIENLSLLGIKFPDKLMLLVNKDFEDKETAKKRWNDKNKTIF